MGKRKTKAKIMSTKKKEPVPTIFDCPFCQHAKTVEAKMDMVRSIGSITCRICGASYQMMINCLSEPTDVYHEWIDHCEAEKERDGGLYGTTHSSRSKKNNDDDDEFDL